jgi:uncharacterized membrane protein
MSDTAPLFSKEEDQRILEAIRTAEKASSGEIRVHVERGEIKDPLVRAREWFEKLEMHKTALRNGVLIYLAPDVRQFSIIGDKGIHEKVGDDFWTSTRDIMQSHFREKRFAEGLVTGINMAGESLREHFPNLEGDKNELSDDISYGD